MSDSDLDPSVLCVVCLSPMARLVVAPTLVAAPTARPGRLVEPGGPDISVGLRLRDLALIFYGTDVGLKDFL